MATTMKVQKSHAKELEKVFKVCHSTISDGCKWSSNSMSRLYQNLSRKSTISIKVPPV